MRQLKITAPACQDLNDIAEYFLERSVDAGDRFVTSFNQKCKHLSQFPHIGKRYEQLKAGIRGIGLMGYIIFYRVTDDTVEILRVVRGDRNLPKLIGDS
ncbi:MAG: type II toxin-antitoxin system RelE/ParE family toxin [Cyanothece sp. SIO2G6]|nr:type II toxin-antitoxin system RelE/ParE family toxin [Cyanothece sp. SIO2G6]